MARIVGALRNDVALLARHPAVNVVGTEMREMCPDARRVGVARSVERRR
jgi:hypothetical protein